MPKPEWTKASARIRKIAALFITACIFLSTGYLLVTNYKSQLELRESAVDRFKYDTERRSTLLKYFFIQRREELRNLVESRAVNVYFESQALGMSLLYGLRATLQVVHRRIESLIDSRTSGSQPIYKAIMMVDLQGDPIVGSDAAVQAYGATRSLADSMRGTGRELPSVDMDNALFVLFEAIPFKNRKIGWIVAWIDPRCLAEYLIRNSGGIISTIGMIHIRHRLYVDRPESFRLTASDRDLIEQMPSGQVQQLQLCRSAEGAKEVLALRVPLEGMPLAFIGLIPVQDVFGRSAPWHVPLALAALSVVLFGGAIFLWRQNIHNLVLRARLDEAAKREKEIAENNQKLQEQIEKGIEMESRLQEGEQRFRNLVESTNDWFWEVDLQGVYTYVGPQVETLLGYTPKEVLGKSVFDFIAPEEASVARRFFQQMVAAHSPIELYDNTLIHKAGHRVTVQTSGLPIVNMRGELLGYRGTDRDITEKIKLEERLRQSQKLESIGTLAGGIAHDFNNILSIMIGNAELAMGSVSQNDAAYHYLAEIKTAGLRAAGIVKQLLSFSRQGDRGFKPTEITGIIGDTLTLMRSTIPATIEIRKNIDVAEATVLADPVQINQVIMNLCINASQSMQETGGVIEIGARAVDLDTSAARGLSGLRKGRYLRITVRDTGTGIDPKVIPRIFDPYFTTKPVGQGSGMGLAVAHGIAKNHGGAVTVESVLGRGSTFSIFLPLAEGVPVAEPQKPEAVRPGEETLLVVDDEPSIAQMITTILARLGYRVETKMNPNQAVELFRSQAGCIDMVITDMTMPQMTGVQLFEKLKQIRPDIPVIICTGHSDRIDEKRAARLGVDAYLMKPVTSRKIAATIRKILDDRKRRAADVRPEPTKQADHQDQRRS